MFAVGANVSFLCKCLTGALWKLPATSKLSLQQQGHSKFYVSANDVCTEQPLHDGNYFKECVNVVPAEENRALREAQQVFLLQALIRRSKLVQRPGVVLEV